MNTPNNKRKRDSEDKIERIFIELLQKKEINEISITDICKSTKLNRSTFYANYIDIYDLADKVKAKLENDVFELYRNERETSYNSNNFLKLFRHIKDNQIFYKTYFKLGYDDNYKIIIYDTNLSKEYFNDEFIDYHITFFKNGLNAIIKMWLKNDCRESPEEINSIIEKEYAHRVKK